MSRSRYRFLTDDTAPYFVTATTVNWLPLFRNPEIVSILISSLRYLIDSRRIELYAYVIMEDHLHLICTGDNLSKAIASFKSYTASKCLDYYRVNQQTDELAQLEHLKMKFKKDRHYQFWQEGSHPQRIYNDAVLQQKVDYIHNNPVKRGYVDLPEDWQYSSARDYAGMVGVLPLAEEM